MPLNGLGYQYARTGDAYSGIELYSAFSSNSREYIEIKLLDTLITGKKYCVKYYVSLSDTSGNGIDKLGAYFSNDSVLHDPVLAGTMLLPYTPQVNNSSGAITDKQNWILISGEYIAVGGELFITIGNFHDDASTNVQNAGNNNGLAYYYIDDVSVTCCDPSGTCTLSLPEPPAESYLPRGTISTFGLSFEERFFSPLIFDRAFFKPWRE